MNELRLLTTATMLYFVSQNKQVNRRFDMRTFRGALPPTPICNTSACAFGWTQMLYPKEIKWVRYSGVWSTRPIYKGYKGTRAIEQFFQIPLSDVFKLFYPYFSALERNDFSETQTAKKAADAIVEYVEQHRQSSNKDG